MCATDLNARTFLPQPRCGELVDHAYAGAVLRESKGAYQTRWTAANLEKDVGEQFAHFSAVRTRTHNQYISLSRHYVYDLSCRDLLREK